jgi:hypothetical protein
MNDDHPTNIKSNRTVVYILLLAILWVAGFIYILNTEVNERIRFDEQAKGLRQELKRTRDKYNREKVSFQALTVEHLELIASKDSLVNQLNQLRKNAKIKDAGETALIFTTETRIDSTSLPLDTSSISINQNGDSVRVSTYSFEPLSPWIKGRLVINGDSVMLSNFAVTNTYEISISKTGGIFRKNRNMEVNIRNNNPYSTTLDAISYQVPVTPPKRGLWLLSGVCIGIGGAIYLIAK